MGRHDAAVQCYGAGDRLSSHRDRGHLSRRVDAGNRQSGAQSISPACPDAAPEGHRQLVGSPPQPLEGLTYLKRKKPSRDLLLPCLRISDRFLKSVWATSAWSAARRLRWANSTPPSPHKGLRFPTALRSQPTPIARRCGGTASQIDFTSFSTGWTKARSGNSPARLRRLARSSTRRWIRPPPQPGR